MGARLELRLTSQGDWLKVFDPRDGTVFVAIDEPIARGTEVRLDLDVGGWFVNLRGIVVGAREQPPGVVVALGGSERDKLNYLYAFVRGGLLNLRDKRRIALRLPVTYGAIEGPANTFTKDINEEGLFLLTDRPLPETSQIHMLVAVPGRPGPLSIMGKVSYVVTPGQEDPPGMGVVFECDGAQREELVRVIRQLEADLEQGRLPPNLVE